MNPDPALFQAAAEGHLSAALELLRELVAVNSFTTNAGGVEEAASITAVVAAAGAAAVAVEARGEAPQRRRREPRRPVEAETAAVDGLAAVDAVMETGLPPDAEAPSDAADGDEPRRRSRRRRGGRGRGRAPGEDGSVDGMEADGSTDATVPTDAFVDGDTGRTTTNGSSR